MPTVYSKLYAEISALAEYLERDDATASQAVDYARSLLDRFALRFVNRAFDTISIGLHEGVDAESGLTSVYTDSHFPSNPAREASLKEIATLVETISWIVDSQPPAFSQLASTLREHADSLRLATAVDADSELTPDDLYVGTVKTVAQLLKRKEPTISKLVDKGILKSVGAKYRRRIDALSVFRFFLQNGFGTDRAESDALVEEKVSRVERRSR